MAPLHSLGSGLRRARRRQHPAAQHPDLRHRTAQGPVTVRPIHLSRRSTRPGCELPPAAPELPVRPNRTEGGAPTGKLRCRSTRPGCEYPPAAPSLSARPNRTEGGAPTECARQTDIRCRSTRPGCECPPAAPSLPARPNRTEGGAPTECARQTDIRCRSTRPGCELPPAAPELPVRPNRTEGGAPTIEPATPSGRSTRPGCEGAVRDNSELAIYRKAGQLFEGVTVDGGGQGLQQVACFIRILAGKVGGVFQRAAGFDGLADDIDVLHATFLNGPAYQRRLLIGAFTHGIDQRQGRLAFGKIVADVLAHGL